MNVVPLLPVFSHELLITIICQYDNLKSAYSVLCRCYLISGLALSHGGVADGGDGHSRIILIVGNH